MLRRASVLTVFLLIAACGGNDTETSVPDSAPPPEPPPPGLGAMVYTGVTVWDGTGSSAQEDVNLVVRDGRVESISPDVPAGAQIVDLAGKWVVPGIINSHGHVSGRWAPDSVTDPADQVRGDLALYARYGVTTVLSQGGAPDEAFVVRADQDDASLTHARLYLSGDVVAGETAELAAAVASANIDKGVDWIKMRVDDNLGAGTKMPWEAVQAAIDIARAAGKPVTTHIFYMDDAARLLAMGTGMIAHSVRDKEVSDEFVQAMLDSGVCYVPTLVREVSTFVYAERPAWFDDPFFQEGALQREIDRVTSPENMQRVANSSAAAAYKEALAQAQANLRILIGSGVPIAFGTDSGVAGRFIGYFEHMEFDLMAEAGLTAREILLSATSGAAGCLGIGDVGTLEPGKWADFIVLNENPLDDIRGMRSIQDVFIAGNKVAR